MLLRSGTFKLPTSLPEPSDRIPTMEQQLPSPLLELSDSDSSPSMQSASGHSVEPPQPETLAIMADAGKNTVTPSKFYGYGREDVDKWLRYFERVAKANQWKEERIAEVLPAVLRDRAADFWEDLTEDQQKNRGLKRTFLAPRSSQDVLHRFIQQETGRSWTCRGFCPSYSRFNSASSLDNGCHGTRAIVQGTFLARVTPSIETFGARF